jgi:molybdenum cofactor biosynthesis enzyme MoaA
MILDRILNDRFTAEELIEILTVVENQFIAERIRRTRLTNPGNVWLGLQELAAVEMQLRRILRKIKDYQSRQPRQDGR